MSDPRKTLRVLLPVLVLAIGVAGGVGLYEGREQITESAPTVAVPTVSVMAVGRPLM